MDFRGGGFIGGDWECDKDGFVKGGKYWSDWEDEVWDRFTGFDN